MNVHEQLIRDWIKKAEHDLKSANILMSSNEELYGNVCFHAQQLVEKALKALLIQKDIEFKKTHNLLILLELLQDTDFDEFRKACELLNSHAVESRYPGDYVEPEQEEAEEVLCIASEIYDLVKRKLVIGLDRNS